MAPQLVEGANNMRCEEQRADNEMEQMRWRMSPPRDLT